MEKGEIDIQIYGPKAEMETLYLQIKMDQPFEEMDIDLDTDSPASVNIHAGYARETDELVDTWKKEGWEVLVDAHIWGWGPQSLHRFDNKEWHDYDFEDIDLNDMDPICENLIGTFGLEDEIKEWQEYA